MSNDNERPHISRIYDYVLGGTFNTEVDRRAAQMLIDRMPSYRRWAKINRSFLGHVGKRWAGEGRGHVLDLGSGLPTQDHLNAHLVDAKILFSDHDAQTVSHGREILAGSRTMAYEHVDIRDSAATTAAAARFFGGERSLAIGLVGVIYFLSDEDLGRLARELHAFCAPGSVMAMSFPSIPSGLNEQQRATIRALEKGTQINFYHRTPDEVAAAMAPWRLTSQEELVDLPGAQAAPAREDDQFLDFRLFGVFLTHS